MSAYSDVIKDAQDLIEEFGCPITLYNLSSTAADAAKPWWGEGVQTVAGTIDSFAVLVPSQGSDLGGFVIQPELLRTVSQVALVAPVVGTDLSAYSLVSYGSERFKLDWVQVLAPAGEPVLYAFGVSK